ncbi:MAG: type II toxin-antitoxin system mRNA interferase toxin, RelE/StbE family [Proteobacteria bacterium]|nr:type II toxin-antitoxin system mRNA interferase toxin, RelE/StbE family [Pseudomonadota bacterium]
MKTITRTNRFKKEFKLMMKRGGDESKFREVVGLIISDKKLPHKYRDHRLVGEYEGSRELHIEPDWLLIYQVTEDELILECTGTHSDLFK